MRDAKELVRTTLGSGVSLGIRAVSGTPVLRILPVRDSGACNVRELFG